ERGQFASCIGEPMNHMEFIEKNVRSELLKQGFSASLAQGGGSASGGIIQTYVASLKARSDV
ncbi:MAG: hypothetical protein RSC68_32760, partial [Acinetobacter sp.]